MTARITPQPGIMQIALYQGGRSAIPGRADVLKLSSNENPLGPPPVAQEAIVAHAAAAHLYPPTDHAELRAAIGEVHGLDPERIICGVGSDEVLQLVTQAFAGMTGCSVYPEDPATSTVYSSRFAGSLVNTMTNGMVLPVFTLIFERLSPNRFCSRLPMARISIRARSASLSILPQ